MKRKLIITESQYNKLQEFLFETADINSTLDYAKVGDILIFKGAFNLKIKVTNYNRSTDEIVGETNFKGQPRKIMFKLNSYDEINKKFSYSIFDENGQNPKGVDFEPKELDIERNGNLVNIPGDANAEKPEPIAKPVANPDDISKPIELDPSTDEEPDEEEYDEMIDDIEAEFKSDDIFRQALYKQPSFLERLSAEIKGEKPKGSGIIIANQLVNSYRDKGSNEYLNADFRKPYIARFKSLERYDLQYEIDDKINYIVFNGEKEAKVGNTNEKNQRKLTDVDKNFEILVTKNISTEKTPNYFLCYVSTYSTKTGNKFKNKSIPVKLQFLDSTGFKVKNS
jgi:hypothetical protein